MRKNSSTTQQTLVISILGAGYVGLTTGAILANCGYKVYLVEPNKARLKTIKSNRSFFYEEGLDNLIGAGNKNGSLLPTSDYATAIPESDFVFSCVGTPDNPDGSSNLSYVFSAAETAATLLKRDAVYVQKSTVPVGTGAKLETIFAKLGKDIRYVSNPEFLREGTALADSLYFDRVVVGSSNDNAREAVINIYKSVELCREQLAKLAGVEAANKPGRYIATNLSSAELIKVTANAFLALKISFANSIAKLADQTGADINEVMDAVGADWRIGRAFLNAGRGYGGGCFPKDVSGLISSATEYGVDLQVMTAAAEVNETMPGYIANKLQEKLGSLAGKRITVLGLAFKAGTSDARRSPGVKLANILAHAGADVTTYDPKAKDEAEAELRKGIATANSIEAALRGSDAVCVATDWPEFLDCNLAKLKEYMAGAIFVDCMNAYDISAVHQAGLQYIGVGRNGEVTS